MKNLESNKLIVDFMGIRPVMYSPDMYRWSDQPYYSIHGDTPEKVMTGIISYVKYDSDWNWLMKVVEKIENIIFDDDNSFNVTIGSTIYCVIQDSKGECYDMTYDGQETKLLCVYKAVVEFIQWYNKNK